MCLGPLSACPGPLAATSKMQLWLEPVSNTPTNLLDNELTTKWLNRLWSTATTAGSRDKHAQLSSILDYYNKQTTGAEEFTAIDFDSYRCSIHTPDVVDKIQAKYNDFFDSAFQVEGAVSRCGARSELMKKLDVTMTYNHHLWNVHYFMHLDSVETLSNIGDPTMLSVQEMAAFHPEADQFNSAAQEIGDISPQDAVENSVVVRLCTQFSWGSRYNPPFVHSNDAISSITATTAKLGK